MILAVIQITPTTYIQYEASITQMPPMRQKTNNILTI